MLNVYTSKHLEGGGGGADSSVRQRGVVKCTAVSCVPRPPLPLYTDRRGAGLAAAAAGWPDNCEQYRQEGEHCHTATHPPLYTTGPARSRHNHQSVTRAGRDVVGGAGRGRGGGGGDGVLVSGRGCVGDSGGCVVRGAGRWCLLAAGGSCAGWRWY